MEFRSDRVHRHESLHLSHGGPCSLVTGEDGPLQRLSVQAWGLWGPYETHASSFIKLCMEALDVYLLRCLKNRQKCE